MMFGKKKEIVTEQNVLYLTIDGYETYIRTYLYFNKPSSHTPETIKALLKTEFDNILEEYIKNIKAIGVEHFIDNLNKHRCVSA